MNNQFVTVRLVPGTLIVERTERTFKAGDADSAVDVAAGLSVAGVQIYPESSDPTGLTVRVRRERADRLEAAGLIEGSTAMAVAEGARSTTILGDGRARLAQGPVAGPDPDAPPTEGAAVASARTEPATPPNPAVGKTRQQLRELGRGRAHDVKTRKGH